jgi:hypothetical protein
MSYTNDQSKKSSTAFDQATTLVTVVELSRNSWLVAGVVPGINRHPLKKLAADENELLALLHRWQQQAVKADREIKRVVHSRLAEMASGSRAGCAHEASSLMLSTRRVLPCHESIVARRPIALTPNTLNGSSLGGCAVSPITAEWWRFRPSRKRMRNVPTGSVKR